MSTLYDPVRQRYVRATPEEVVRQELLKKMIGSLGYPKGLLAVEKDLGTPRRRVDLICYTPKTLLPLLIVECKAEECTKKAQEQAFGYNTSLGAPFVCLAGKTEIVTLWFDRGAIVSVPFLPAYCDLVHNSSACGPSKTEIF